MESKYTTLQQVGEGTYGSVWKAVDNGTKEMA